MWLKASLIDLLVKAVFNASATSCYNRSHLFPFPELSYCSINHILADLFPYTDIKSSSNVLRQESSVDKHAVVPQTE